MKLVIGSDHAAFDAKELLRSFLLSKGYDVVDVGPKSSDRCNYPDYAIALVKKMRSNDEFLGILLCGSGVGMSMTANRFKGIRAALCRNANEAKISKEHNNSNVLCMGGRVSSSCEINEMTLAWLDARFEGGRHQERVAIFDQLGE
jgi:ribose 5-phosphate isomerase B